MPAVTPLSRNNPVRELSATEFRQTVSITRALFLLLLTLLIGMLTGCAVGPKKSIHSLKFDAVFRMTDIEIVDWQYGNGAAFSAWTRCMPIAEDRGRCLQRQSANELTEIGETLYVKWKIKSTGEILQDTIVMKKVLPNDIYGMQLVFYVKQRQLYLFLDTRLAKPKGWPEYEVMEYQVFKNYQLYPTSNLPK